MNRILALTLVIAFAGSAHAQTPVHPKGAAGIVNKASVPAQNSQGNASTAAGTGNATRSGAPKCIQADAPKNGATGTPCHPARTARQ